jgi:chromosome segregation ATPase
VTQHEQIKEHLRAIINICAPGNYWGCSVIVFRVQEELDAIKELLDPDPEVVQRLIDLSNDLGRENAVLRNDLTEMTLDLNAAEKYASALKADLVNKSRLYLEEVEHARKLEEEVVRKDNTLKSAHSHLVEVRRGYEEDLVDTSTLAAHRKKLLAEAKEEIVCKNDLIKALEQRLAVVERDRAYARIVNPWRQSR